jgi:lysine/ornithine N-monooxygenase
VVRAAAIQRESVAGEAAVFLDIEKVFDTTWHPGLLYKLSELQFATSLVKLITSLLTNRKLKVSVGG